MQNAPSTHKRLPCPLPLGLLAHEDGRSKCRYVGLTNLGATCYMATCMQHLYMILQARQSVLPAKVHIHESKHNAYNPQGFCKVYTMDKQPLNTGEQKDMTEFFTNLITKLEAMSPDMKKLIKSLFGGVITYNVVSLRHHQSMCQHQQVDQRITRNELLCNC